MHLFYILLTMAVFMSRAQIWAPTGTGVLPLFTIPITIFIALSLFFLKRVRTNWLIGITLFITACVLNNSSILSVGLITVSLLVHMWIQRTPIALYMPMIQRLILYFLIFGLFLVTIDLLFNLNIGLWSSSKELDLPRLRIFSDEASYLGVLLAIVLYTSKDGKLSFMSFSFLALSQSYYAFALYLCLLFRKKIKVIIILGIIGSCLIIPKLLMDPGVYFSNSGYIRLIGLYALTSMDLSQGIFGSGIGEGDLYLTSLFNSRGVESGSGFLFTWIYDVGLLGIIGYYLCICRTRFEVILLTFMLLNFGAASLYICFVFALIRTETSKDD